MKSRLAALAILVLASSSTQLRAQYIGDQFPGLTGLKAGSLPGAGLYVTAPLFLRDSNISINNAQGNQTLKNATTTLNVFILPSVKVVTPFKVLGANYSASFTQWLINGVIDVAAVNFKRSTGYGYGDIYVSPATLGWHLKRADITTGYAFFAPTGKDSSGQHMWVNELDFGGTVYVDAAKKWNVSSMMYYDFHQRKRNTDVKVGDILTLGGGIGRSFMKGAGNVGVSYTAQWKTTHDSGSGIPTLLPTTNGRLFGVGPEIGFPIFAKGLNMGLVSFRYQWLVGARTALGGQVLTTSFTFVRFKAP